MCAPADHSTSFSMHQRGDGNNNARIFHQLHLHQPLPPIPHGTQPPYIVQPDVDNELLSLFMAASGEDDAGVQWATATGGAPICQYPTLKTTASSRLARKAELARASRLRKKQYINDLERRVGQLKEAVSQAQGRVRRVSNVLRVPSAAGQERRSAQYLNLATQCLAPSIPVKFVFWSLDQPEEFYSQSGLWHSLVEGEIGLGDDQVAALRAHQMTIRSLRQSMARAKLFDDKLHAECWRIEELIAEESGKFQEILTEEQVRILQRWAASHDFAADLATASPVR